MAAPTPFMSRIMAGRVVPLLVPRLKSYADRVTIHQEAHGELPAADLTSSIVTGTYRMDGKYCEIYVFVRNGDVDAFMAVSLDEETGYVEAEVSRCAFAAMDVSLDDAVVCSFPELSTPLDAPATGYYAFVIEEGG